MCFYLILFCYYPAIVTLFPESQLQRHFISLLLLLLLLTETITRVKMLLRTHWRLLLRNLLQLLLLRTLLQLLRTLLQLLRTLLQQLSPHPLLRINLSSPQYLLLKRSQASPLQCLLLSPHPSPKELLLWSNTTISQEMLLLRNHNTP